MSGVAQYVNVTPLPENPSGLHVVPRDETPQALAYLRARGINLEALDQHGIELRSSTGYSRPQARDYRLRLKLDRRREAGPLHELVTESIWVPCNNPNGSTESWIVRPFPTLQGKDLVGDSFPFPILDR